MARPLTRFRSRLAEARNLKDLLPDGAHVIFSEPRHADAELHPLEQEFLRAQHMQPVREREFRVGRALAREALAQFGIAGHALLPAETREPAVAARHRWQHQPLWRRLRGGGRRIQTRLPGLGIDLESIGRIDDSIAGTVCTADERRQLDAMPASSRQRHLSLLFSAKESVFKALFPLTRQFLEFDDVHLDVADGRFTARAVRRNVEKVELLHGRYFAGPHLIVTAAWLPAA